MSEYDINIAACRARQARLVDIMHERHLDLIVVRRPEHVQWLAGPRYAWTFEPAAALTADSRLTLVVPSKKPEVAAADEVVTYEAKWHSTMRNDQATQSAAALLKALEGHPKPKRIGVEFSCGCPAISTTLAADMIDIEPDLFRLRRHKDHYEMALLRKAIAGTGAMYRKAREIIKPGINELDVFNQLQAAAVCEFGEMLTGTGNDYACGERGGPPRNRKARDGELYILDLGPAFRGYFADTCRTIAVNGRPTDRQRQAWTEIAKVFPIVEQTVRPGKSCRELFNEVSAFLDHSSRGVFGHHLGHGIGLNPHEGPHLNPHWDDTFEEGDVFTVEPGLYAPDLHAGIRLENDYLVTADGVELLSDFPLEL